MREDFQAALTEIKGLDKPTCTKVQEILEELRDERPADPDAAYDWDTEFDEFLGETWSLSTCTNPDLMQWFAEAPTSGCPVFATSRHVLEYNADQLPDNQWATYPWRELYADAAAPQLDPNSG
jgi:hypothetical protein